MKTLIISMAIGAFMFSIASAWSFSQSVYIASSDFEKQYAVLQHNYAEQQNKQVLSILTY